MKNILITIFIFFNFLLINSVSSQTNRNVIWLHGLGSNANSWQDTPQEFSDNYFINSRVGNTYSSNSGVQVYTNQARSRYNHIQNQNNILVGQSMGGVVGRYLLSDTPNFGGGLISMGSPLNGAYISNSKAMNRILPTFSDAYNRITNGPLATYGILLETIFTITNQITENDLSVSDLNDIFIQSLMDRTSAGSSMSQAEQDLRVKSQLMLNMINTPLNKPHLAIWGEEYSPVSVNYLATLIANNQLDIGGFITLNLGFVTKSNMLSMLNSIIDVYNAYEVYYYFQIANPFVIGAYFKSQLWKEGKNYFQSGMEDDWNYLIGTNRVDYYEVCYDEISCDWDDLLLNPNPECEFIVVCANYPVQINTKSDGYIDASSQQGHRFTQQPTHVVRALGVNHHELYFHETPKAIIENAFNNQYDPFFETSQRN